MIIEFGPVYFSVKLFIIKLASTHKIIQRTRLYLMENCTTMHHFIIVSYGFLYKKKVANELDFPFKTSAFSCYSITKKFNLCNFINCKSTTTFICETILGSVLYLYLI